jgi:hypothetical protein
MFRALVWHLDPAGEPREDARQYHVLAQNLVWEGVYSTDGEAPYRPSARRVPGTPLVYAAVYALRGSPDVAAAKLASGLMGVAACELLFLLSLRMTGDLRVAVVSGLLAALSPPLMLAGSGIGLEAVFTPLLIGAVWTTCCWHDARSIRWALLSGALWGCLTLVKPESALLPVALATAAMALAPSRRRLLQAAAAAFVCGGVVAPWILRNAAVMGRPGLQFGRADEGGGEGGAYLRSYRLYAENGFTFWPKRYTYLYGDNWQEREAEFQTAINGPVRNLDESDVAFWLKRPHLLAKYTLVRFIGLMKPESWSRTFGLDRDFSELSGAGGKALLAAKAALLGWDFVTLGLCAVGFLWSLQRKNKRLWIITATIVYFVAIYSLLHGIPRYRVPLLPLGFLLGSAWLVAQWDRRKERFAARPAAARSRVASSPRVSVEC